MDTSTNFPKKVKRTRLEKRREDLTMPDTETLVREKPVLSETEDFFRYRHFFYLLFEDIERFKQDLEYFKKKYIYEKSMYVRIVHIGKLRNVVMCASFDSLDTVITERLFSYCTQQILNVSASYGERREEYEQ